MITEKKYKENMKKGSVHAMLSEIELREREKKKKKESRETWWIYRHLQKIKLYIFCI